MKPATACNSGNCRQPFMKTNKFRVLLLLFVQVIFAVSLNGQNGPCFRFVDTLYLKANVLHV